jgi:aminoglycoside phosphotransferase (APT) family kinase protein
MGDYPWPFTGYPLVPGQTACVAALTTEQRTEVAAPLGSFLAILHAVPAAEAARLGAGPDPLARLDLARCIPRARERLDALVRRRLVDDAAPLTALLDAAPPAYSPRADTLVHADLYARHLLIDGDNRLAGVIDWGDVHLGDPAVDLAIAYTFLPPAAREAFCQAYGPMHDMTWRVARLRGLWHTAAVLTIACDIGDTALEREARQALQHLALA